MVTCVLARQPVLSAYVMDAVPPVNPSTVPPATVATVLLLLAQVPPDVTSESREAVPEQKDLVPVMTAGFGLTVNPKVALQPVANV